MSNRQKLPAHDGRECCVTSSAMVHFGPAFGRHGVERCGLFCMAVGSRPAQTQPRHSRLPAIQTWPVRGDHRRSRVVLRREAGNGRFAGNMLGKSNSRSINDVFNTRLPQRDSAPDQQFAQEYVHPRQRRGSRVGVF